MIVSERSPKLSRSPKPPAKGESGSRQALLSVPVTRKLRASGSAVGKPSVTGVDPFGVVTTTPGAAVSSGPVSPGLGICGAKVTRFRLDNTHWPVAKATAADIAITLPVKRVITKARCDHLEREVRRASGFTMRGV